MTPQEFDQEAAHEAWFKEWEEYQEWLSHQHAHDDFNDYEETE